MQGARHLLILLFVPSLLMTIFVLEFFWLARIELLLLIGLIFVIFKKKS